MISFMLGTLIQQIEAGRVPDALVRAGVRRLCRQRLKSLNLDDCEAAQRHLEEFLEQVRQSPVVVAADKANEQHYEWPAAFFRAVLGEHLKYSCCYWDEGTTSLTAAEEVSLRLTCEHAELRDGQRVLELGCGWGSLSLWMAAQYPGSRIVAVSNSHSQREYITARASARGLRNLEVITADVGDFEPAGTFDRVVSVEMFEHVRNHALLLSRIANWLTPEGKLFVHIFCHRRTPYLFETDGEDNWMGRYFFTGGMMPSDDLLVRCQAHLTLQRQWRWNGTHYQKTSQAWLARMDRRRGEILALFEELYPPGQARVWLQRWRLFFLAVAEFFGLDDGQQWWVSHYLFQQPQQG